jgi:hypothetical protein
MVHWRISSFYVRLAASLCIIAAASTCAQAATIGLNFTGVTLADGKTLNSNNGYAPPDNGGAVGPSHLVQLINGAYAVYDKSTGAQTELISARQFWINAGVDPGTDIVNLGTFNARIVYDPTVDRWIAAALTGQTTNNSVMIARSDTSDPGGTWKAVSFLGNNNGGTSGAFADYTGLGLDADGVYVTTNNFSSNSPMAGFDYASAYSLPKADLLAPTPTIANLTRFDELSADAAGTAIQPIIDFGPSKGHAPMLGIFNAGEPFLPLYRTDITGTTGPGAVLSEPTTIDIGQYIEPPGAAQPDGTRTISTIDGRISSHVYQLGDTIYGIHAIKQGNNAALEWFKIDEPTNTVIQEGILGDVNFDYFNGSIAANELGDIVIGFTRSGNAAGGNLSAYALIGETTGGVTTFAAPLLLKEGLVGNYHVFNDRWGDFTTTVVDPTNPLVFWTFQEHAMATNAWATQITQIIVPEPSGVVPGLAAVLALAWLAVQRQRRRRGASGV